MSDHKNELEAYMAEKLKEIDPYSRPTRGSGSGNEIADISNKYFYVECKMKRTKANVTLDYKKEWLKLNKEIPLGSKKIPIVAIENKYGEKFVILNSEDFFKLLEK